MTNYLSGDGTTAVTIEAKATDAILNACRLAGEHETGGILIGHYTEGLDGAIVVEATGPPADSLHGAMSFFRGFRGLGVLLRRRWRSHQHYLGEWHFHPRASSTPSRRDIDQMREFARNPSYRCERPVLVVIGGDASKKWECSVTVVEGQVAVTHLRLVEVR